MAARIECTLQSCNCECYVPSSPHLRVCESCNHSWVFHAAGKLTTQTVLPSFQVIDVVNFNIVFDIGSLILYGAQAVPIRLKIILDRLFSVLKHEEVLQVLHGLGWIYEDYARGYILQCDAKVLEKWVVASKEEENLILQHCLRFGETKLIAETMLHQEQKEKSDDIYFPTPQESDIRNFIQRLNSTSSVVSSNAQTSSPNFFVRNCHTDIQQSCISHSTTTTPPPLSTQQLASPGSLGETTSDFRLQTSDLTIGSQVDSAGVSSSTMTPASSGETQKQLAASTNFSVASSRSCSNTLLARMEMPSSINKPYSTSALLASRIMKRLRRPPTSLAANKQSSSLRLLYSVNATGAKQVTCNACGKAFYNKGTWKIHYSSVHLKEKHKCTIDGCNMYFSSQRSRNRHSANPNPKIHSGVPKLCMKLSDTRSVLFGSRGNRVLGNSDNPPTILGYRRMLTSSIGSKDKMTTSPNTGILCHTTETPEEHEGAHTLPFPGVVNTQTTGVINTALVAGGNSEDRKKSRKPLNPIKVEQNDLNEYSSVGNSSILPVKQTCSKRKSNTPTKCPISINEYFSGEEISDSEDEMEREEKIVGEKNPDNRKEIFSPSPESSTLKDNIRQNKEINNCSLRNDERHASNGAASHYKDESFDLEKMGKDYFAKYLGNDKKHAERTSVHDALVVSNSFMDKGSSNNHDDYNQDSDDATTSPESLPNNSSLNHTLNSCYFVRDGVPFCVECSKPFQSVHGVKTHFQNVHLKIMHKCMVTGCSAEFPSKRSRDRHSSNVNLHLRLLEKGTFSDKGIADCQQDPINLTERYFPTINRQVTAASETEKSPIGEQLQYHQIANSLFSLPGSSGRSIVIHSSLESELLSAGSKSLINEEKIAIKQELIDTRSTSSTETEKEREKTFVSAESLSFPLFSDGCLGINGHIESESGIYHGPGVVCNICQKVYSTKDTLRVHYKNVHLREMHKCKVPGCNKVFSSVRSRNRHSQNPNLHE